MEIRSSAESLERSTIFCRSRTGYFRPHRCIHWHEQQMQFHPLFGLEVFENTGSTVSIEYARNRLLTPEVNALLKGFRLMRVPAAGRIRRLGRPGDHRGRIRRLSAVAFRPSFPGNPQPPGPLAMFSCAVWPPSVGSSDGVCRLGSSGRIARGGT